MKRYIKCSTVSDLVEYILPDIKTEEDLDDMFNHFHTYDCRQVAFGLVDRYCERFGILPGTREYAEAVDSVGDYLSDLEDSFY